MTTEFLATEAGSLLQYSPTEEQSLLLSELSRFITEMDPRGVFILNGHAGTGKTSLLAAMINALNKNKIKTVILAPTGKAAKVAEKFSGHRAYTIHKRIYRLSTLEPTSFNFILDRNRSVDTVFIVDEASMITDGDGSRSLLFHLCKYVYSAPGCRIIFSGDTAQLPPVGQIESQAMNPERLRQLGLNPTMFHLEKPMRQAAKSGILRNAEHIRKLIDVKRIGEPTLPKFILKGYKDIVALDSREVFDTLSSSWSKVGEDETILITRSNFRANRFNLSVRQQVLYADDVLERGEKIVIAKNNYYWSKVNKMKGFIANGETATVTWIGKKEKRFGRWFVDCELTFSGQEEPFAAKIMLRSLNADGPAIPREESERFYNAVVDSKSGEGNEKIMAALEDPFYNALQVKYAYSITCHKAQGGQWKHVYIDLGGLMIENIDSEFYRWLYTAITRATEKIFLIGYPEE